MIPRPVSESESEWQRARNGTSESERDFSRERATIHTRESKRAKFKTAPDFSFYSAVPATVAMSVASREHYIWEAFQTDPVIGIVLALSCVHA